MHQTTLAIDFGTKRIGIAISRGTLAEPLMILKNDAEVFDRISQILSQEHVAQIVVGLSENKMAELTQEFVELLRKKTVVPVVFTDETLSSYTVHQKLRFAKKNKRAGNIDHYAAAEFLQEWLDTN